MRAALTDVVARRGWYDGLVAGGVLATLVLLADVVFPAGDDGVVLVGGCVLLSVVFAVVGARGQRRGNTRNAGARAAAVAAFVVAVLVVAFLAVRHLLPGVSSMPAFAFLIRFLTLVGALLGEFGGSLVRDRRVTVGSRPAGR